MFRRSGPFYKFFRVVLFQIHLGSGAAQIRIRNDFFLDLYPDPDPAESFGTEPIQIRTLIWIRIHNTERERLHEESKK
jgi:hypothetical protein